jgi:hypothetical protein
VKPDGKKSAGEFGLSREAEKEPVGMRMQLLQDQAHHHHTRIIIEAKMCESRGWGWGVGGRNRLWMEAKSDRQGKQSNRKAAMVTVPYIWPGNQIAQAKLTKHTSLHP